MGNTIIKASHVGSVQRQVAKYNGPPSEEDVAIAKRAAERTRKAWAEREKQEAEKKKAKLAKRKRAQERKEAAKATRASTKEKRGSSSEPQRLSPQNRRDKNNMPEARNKPARVRVPGPLTPAEKLGITDAEFERRLKALRKFESENSS